MWLWFQAQHLSGKGIRASRDVPASADNSFLSSTTCPQVRERFLVRIFGSEISSLKEVPGVFPEAAKGMRYGCLSASSDPNSERAGDGFPEFCPPSSGLPRTACLGRRVRVETLRGGIFGSALYPLRHHSGDCQSLFFLNINHVLLYPCYYFNHERTMFLTLTALLYFSLQEIMLHYERGKKHVCHFQRKQDVYFRLQTERFQNVQNDLCLSYLTYPVFFLFVLIFPLTGNTVLPLFLD